VVFYEYFDENGEFIGYVNVDPSLTVIRTDDVAELPYESGRYVPHRGESTSRRASVSDVTPSRRTSSLPKIPRDYGIAVASALGSSNDLSNPWSPAKNRPAVELSSSLFQHYDSTALQKLAAARSSGALPVGHNAARQHPTSTSGAGQPTEPRVASAWGTSPRASLAFSEPQSPIDTVERGPQRVLGLTNSERLLLQSVSSGQQQSDEHLWRRVGHTLLRHVSSFGRSDAVLLRQATQHKQFPRKERNALLRRLSSVIVTSPH